MSITREQLKNIVKETLKEESEYQVFFRKALEKAGKSIPSMSDEEKKEFFNKIDKAWNGKGEKNEGNAFGAAVVAAKEKGEDEFEVDGKTYKVESVVNEDANMNKKVKQLLDKNLKELTKGKPNHQFAVMHILMGALSDANFHSEAKKVAKLFPRAKYEGDPMAAKDVEEYYHYELGPDVANICKWDGKDIVMAMGFYVSMTIGRPVGEKVEKLVESVNESASCSCGCGGCSESVNEARTVSKPIKVDDDTMVQIVGDNKGFRELTAALNPKTGKPIQKFGYERGNEIADSKEELIKKLQKKYGKSIKFESVNEAKNDDKYVVIDFHEKGGGFVMTKPGSKKDAEDSARSIRKGSDISKREVLKVSDARKIRGLAGKNYLNEEFKSKDSTFEKVYGTFDKRDYFNAKGLAKVQIGNFERALQRNDKGAQQILDKFKGDMGKAKDYITQVITDRRKEQAFNDYKALKAAVDSIQKGNPITGAVDLVKSRAHNNTQKYTMALYSALRGKKFNNYKDIHADVDSLIGESVNEARLGKVSLLKSVENGETSRVEGVNISPELAFELRMFLQRPLMARSRTGIQIDNSQMKDAIPMLAKVGVHKRLSSGVKKEFTNLLKKYK